MSYYRRDVINSPECGAQHAAQGCLRDVEGAGQVGVEHLLPLLALHAQREGVAGDAGVVDEHLDGAQLAAHILDKLHALALDAHVRLEGLRLPAGRLDLAGDLLGGTFGVHVVHRNPVAAPAKLERHCATQPAAGTCDENCTGAFAHRASCKVAVSTTLTARASPSVRETRPVSTLPLPNSTNRFTPSSTRSSIVATQRTALGACSSSRPAMRV